MVEADRALVMSPAGNPASLAAALQGGADAVYFGVGELNMRAGGNTNFGPEELYDTVQRCHQANAKAYLTLNTVVYEEELTTMQRLLESAKEARVDAVIVSDQAAIEAAAALKIPVHISTQLSISNSATVGFYSQWADVVVLARELTLEQIAAIHKQIIQENILGPSGKPVRIELFCHGAFCMAISGKCYLSLHDSGRSANRGECIQICRRSYRMTDNETGHEIDIDNRYLMSPKDLCTISFLDQIIGAGVGVLKIEGRARSPEYVREVTACYREALTALEKGAYTPQAIQHWEKRLATVFNRGFWDGYYLGRPMPEWTNRYGNQATERKRIAGTIKNFFQKARVADILVEGQGIAVGDHLFVIGSTTGVLDSYVEEIRIDEKRVPSVKAGERCQIKLSGRARRGDKIFVRYSV